MLRIAAVVTALALSLIPAGASAQPDPLGILWTGRGAALLRVACKQGDVDERYCRAIALRDSSGTRILGTGYMRVRLLWRRHGGGRGPDVLVHGDNGGSGGAGDLFAVTLDGSSTRVAKYNGERLDAVRVQPDSALRLDLPFDIEFFNGAPHAGARIVPIPTVWANGGFSADIHALVRPAISKQELDFRELAISEELRGWAEATFPTSRLFPPEAASGTPVTVQALIELMLTGHADEASALLNRAWPSSPERLDIKLGGEQDFWRALCRAVVREPNWRRLGLVRLPHSKTIYAGAK